MRAIEILREMAKVAPEEVLQRVHGALGATRGAAGAVARWGPRRTEATGIGHGVSVQDDVTEA
jgi:hypothetical protein